MNPSQFMPAEPPIELQLPVPKHDTLYCRGSFAALIINSILKQKRKAYSLDDSI